MDRDEPKRTERGLIVGLTVAVGLFVIVSAIVMARGVAALL